MPELPDLAVMAKHLSKQLTNHTVQEVTLHVDRKANATQEQLNNALGNHKVKSIYREGKELHLEIGSSILGFHLMLHGEIRLVGKGEEVKFPILQIDFPTQSLFLTDWQKSATPTLNPEPSEVPDALDFEPSYLKGVLAKKKGDVKSVFLDQKVIRGIGNTYADEIFYHAGISPLSIASAIPADVVGKLVNSIHQVLTNEIENISTKDPERITGENKEFLKIHLPKTKSTAKGEEILIDKKGSRKTYYTSSQIVYK
ncbi:DNA-formamidopyrimidine glycosylase family protein [Pedobacter sp. Leaf132]|uniref:DNA-formamidopyrimidine glycosylase family protein n=1 Tax=Pedobacter sp. Leaf132 TaxID=2876557 RepID=UPI001E2926CD|nr:DNA-formamidopyrimidine glycosylase family protein [Pedobacter sp. Leaf132]